MEAADRGEGMGEGHHVFKDEESPCISTCSLTQEAPRPHPFRVLWRIHYIGTLDEMTFAKTD